MIKEIVVKTKGADVVDIKQLEFFITVAEHLNFSRAAEALYVSQPALSYQISELEKELGQQLFVRDRRNIRLTAAGNVLLRPARDVVNQALQLRSIAEHGQKAENLDSGFLKIALDATEDHFETTGITEVIADFVEQHPNVDMEFSLLDLPGIKDQTAVNEMDLSIAVMLQGEKMPSALSSLMLREDRIALVIRDDLPYRTCEEVVTNMELIQITSKPRRTRSRIINSFTEMGLFPRLLVVDSLAVGFTYTDAGRGAMMLPMNYFDQHNYRRFRAVDIPAESAKIAHVAVWGKHNLNPMLPLLLRRLEEYARK